MKKENLATILSAISVIAGIIVGIRTGQRWWYYLLLIFIISPAFGGIGYVLGKEDIAIPGFLVTQKGCADCDSIRYYIEDGVHYKEEIQGMTGQVVSKIGIRKAEYKQAYKEYVKTK